MVYYNKKMPQGCCIKFIKHFLIKILLKPRLERHFFKIIKIHSNLKPTAIFKLNGEIHEKHSF